MSGSSGIDREEQTLSDTSKTSPDPLVHRQREQQLIQHVERLLEDERLRIDTILGRRPITAFTRDVSRTDRAVELKRQMSEMGVPDRELQGRMPIGEMIEVTLSQKRLWIFRSTVGRLRVVCVSPTKSLIKGEQPQPMNNTDVQRALSQLPASPGSYPTTVVLISTAGFTVEAHELAERSAERTVILVEPNDAGGWTTTGPTETKALSDLFDPEGEDQKRQRVKQFIDANKVDLLTSGLPADRIAAKVLLPQQVVEAELKSYARDNAGLTAKRLDGKVVLFREGTAPPAASSPGGAAMPLIERVKALFARKGDSEKKIAFLSERRAALSMQRDRAYEDMTTLEQQEALLKEQFKNAAGAIGKRRITGQMLQLRKDLERRQQLLSVLNQQINVVSTHLHNLELVQQGQVAQLPNTDEMTADAVKAEEMLAELEADAELAGTVGSVATAGMTEEEQALFEELERETGKASAAPAAEPIASAPEPQPAPPVREQVTEQPTAAPQAQRTEPEPG